MKLCKKEDLCASDNTGSFAQQAISKLKCGCKWRKVVYGLQKQGWNMRANMEVHGNGCDCRKGLRLKRLSEARLRIHIEEFKKVNLSLNIGRDLKRGVIRAGLHLTP